MKIVNIVPGFGGTFYCGNCLRDSAYASSLRDAGHDAVILPVYLPLTLKHDHGQGEIPVFYGAVSIYLKQQFPLFRKMPGWMENLFDSGPLLNLAAKKAGSTRAHGMEDLTESMLRGEDGYQDKELQHLVDFLKDHEKPDIVHLSNALLLGMAEQIKRDVGVPVVCSLQDEDVWMDAMEPSRQQGVWDLMKEKARSVDAFIAVSHFFAVVMKEKLSIPSERLHVIPIGVKPEDYPFTRPAAEPQAIGYLSRICHENGFGILVDAFILLKKEERFRNLELHATGGMTGDDKPFLKKQTEKLRKNNIREDFILYDDFSPEGLKRFFPAVSLISVPVLKGEAFGLYQIEALASGIPIVQPALGAFPEIVEASGGGRIYSPNTPEALAEMLKTALSNPQLLAEAGISGRKAVGEVFNCASLTGKMIDLYRSLL